MLFEITKNITSGQNEEDNRRSTPEKLCWLLLVDFYGITTFVGYLMPNSFLYK